MNIKDEKDKYIERHILFRINKKGKGQFSSLIIHRTINNNNE
jgi:hypothetical protein